MPFCAISLNLHSVDRSNHIQQLNLGSPLPQPRGGSWELAGSCVGCPIDGLRELRVTPPPPSTADGYLPMTAYNTTAKI